MKVIGLLIVLVVGYYIYSSYVETRDVEKLCSTYPEGARADNILEVAERWSGQLMGPIEAEEKSGSYSFTYCAASTMCDVSCSLEIEDGVVVKSEYSSL